jgi:hypothetical protein
MKKLYLTFLILTIILFVATIAIVTILAIFGKGHGDSVVTGLLVGGGLPGLLATTCTAFVSGAIAFIFPDRLPQRWYYHYAVSLLFLLPGVVLMVIWTVKMLIVRA